MANWVAISRQRHQKAGWQKYTNFTYTAKDHIAPVVHQELHKLLAGKVLAFAPQKDSFILVTVQSLEAGSNWYVTPDGRWIGGYIPAIYRSHPFRLLTADSSTPENKLLCVDGDSGLWSEECKVDQLPVFEESGGLTEELTQLLDFVQKCEDSRALVQRSVDQLQKAGVIVPWNIQWQPSSDDKIKKVEGLFRIDEVKLKALPAEELKALTESAALGVAYAQLFSMAHLQVLRMLGKAKREAVIQSGTQQETQAADVDLDQLFGGDEDVLKF